MRHDDGFPKPAGWRYNRVMSSTDTSQPGPAIDENGWDEVVKNMLRGQMMHNGVSYAALAERLATLGVDDNELNLRNKVARGRFSATFFVQCMKALGTEWVHIPGELDAASRKGGAQALARDPRTPGG